MNEKWAKLIRKIKSRITWVEAIQDKSGKVIRTIRHWKIR